MMKHKKNQPTAQELYRARKQREEEEKEANLPPGLINHGNTCFMNSTLQGLMATELLHNLVKFRPIPPALQSTLGTAIAAKRSPQLTNGHGLGGEFDHPWVEGMPLGDVFIDVMRKAWDIQEARRRETMSPKDLLFTMGRKYDQYLDFRQQDAHEFLRHMLDAMRMEELDIIKQRQPPPPKESRKRSHKHRSSLPAPRASTSSAAPSVSTSTSAPALTNDEKLTSFVDMLFGGHLASILVCEKCKKVSLTYEAFNDLSLSIQPEDYVKNRKRDRFKRLARKLRGPFRPPGEGSGSGTAMHRSSSVPADRLRRSLEAAAQEEPPSNEGPRRRSFDHATVEEEGEGEGEADEEARDVVREMARTQDAGSPTAVEDDEGSGGTSEGKEGGTAADDLDKVEEGKGKDKVDDEVGEDKEKEKEKEKKDKEDPWGRFGRRLSVSMKKGMKALDPGSPNRSIERGRRIGAKDHPKAHVAKDSEPEASKPSRPALSPAYDSGSDASEVSDAVHFRVASPSPLPISSPLANPPISAPIHPAHIRRRTALPSRRKKEPHAPKPSREEAAYLRQLLADIHTSGGNPFSVLHQAISSASHGTPPASAAQQAWAKIGHLPGIEECLRLFTAVEILDGENMVGCHRCWKIANGVYKPRRQGIIAEDDEEDEDAASEGEGSSGSSPKREASAPEPIASAQEPPASGSQETLSSSPERSISDAVSPTSTSAVQSLVSLSDNLSETTSMTAPTTVGSGSAANVPEKDPGIQLISPTRPTTYGGLPIPLISTTAPESPIRSTASQAESIASAASSSGRRPKSPLGVSPSDDSLLTPRGRRRTNARANGGDANSDNSDDSYDSDSDVSASTSAYSDVSSIASPSVSPSASPRASVENLRIATSSPADRPEPLPPRSPRAKVSRSKQVILRRMYKRYLIAEPPPILVVHLKRFQQTNKAYTVSFTGAGGVKKLDDFVAFPEFLDLAPFLAPRREDFGLEGKAQNAEQKGHIKDDHQCMYRLYAVVVHIGNMLGGHYVAYTALPPSQSTSTQPQAPATPDSSNSSTTDAQADPMTSSKSSKAQRQWAYISDTVVRLTTIDEVLKAKAYICMYERI